MIETARLLVHIGATEFMRGCLDESVKYYEHALLVLG
jgi:hypothetical protein